MAASPAKSPGRRAPAAESAEGWDHEGWSHDEEGDGWGAEEELPLPLPDSQQQPATGHHDEAAAAAAAELSQLRSKLADADARLAEYARQVDSLLDELEAAKSQLGEELAACSPCPFVHRGCLSCVLCFGTGCRGRRGGGGRVEDQGRGGGRQGSGGAGRYCRCRWWRHAKGGGGKRLPLPLSALPLAAAEC